MHAQPEPERSPTPIVAPPSSEGSPVPEIPSNADVSKIFDEDSTQVRLGSVLVHFLSSILLIQPFYRQFRLLGRSQGLFRRSRRVQDFKRTSRYLQGWLQEPQSVLGSLHHRQRLNESRHQPLLQSVDVVLLDPRPPILSTRAHPLPQSPLVVLPRLPLQLLLRQRRRPRFNPRSRARGKDVLVAQRNCPRSSRRDARNRRCA